MKPVVVIREPWRADPLAWIHRGEARAIARELGAPLAEYRRGALPERALLRLSDPAMLRAVGEIDIPHFGPGREALERCYDKHEANRIVAAAGIDVPKTDFALAARLAPAPRWRFSFRRGSPIRSFANTRFVRAAGLSSTKRLPPWRNGSRGCSASIGRRAST